MVEGLPANNRHAMLAGFSAPSALRRTRTGVYILERMGDCEASGRLIRSTPFLHGGQCIVAGATFGMHCCADRACLRQAVLSMTARDSYA